MSERFEGVEKFGGERGIRTPEAREGLPVFKTGVINRSTSSPSTVLGVLAFDFNDLFWNALCVSK